METIPTTPEQEPTPLGMHYLELLEVAHLATVIMPKSGKPLSEFLDVCGPDAIDQLEMLDEMGKEKDPDFEATRLAIQAGLTGHLLKAGITSEAQSS